MEELKLIMKQNMINEKLLQCILLYLGVKKENLSKTLD